MGRIGSNLLTDLRISARRLMRAPGFGAAAILTLGLGLGGSTAIMTILDGVVLRPLPYAEPDRLVQIQNDVPGVGEGTVWGASTAQYVHFDERVPALDALGLHRRFGGNVETLTGPERVSAAQVTPGLLPMLGATAVHGRLFTESDEDPEEPSVMLLSEEFWSASFGRDPDVIGRTLVVAEISAEIVGVVGEGFRLPGVDAEYGQVYLPIRIDRAGRFWNSHVYRMVARLAPGQSPAGVASELRGTLPSLVERFPDAYSQQFFDRYGFHPLVTPLKEAVVGPIAANLWILLGGVGIVLLIALANVTNLFVVRIEERRTELAVRSALGAGRAALARLLASEALAVSFAGAAISLIVLFWGVPALLSLSPDSLPRADEIRPGMTGVVTAVVLAIVSAFAIVTYPLLVHVPRATGRDRGERTRSTTAGRSRQRLRSALVVAQVALALTLASGAGLLLRSIQTLSAVDPGFEPAGGMTMDVYLDRPRYETDVSVWQAYAAILEKVRALPDVQAAGLSTALPLTGAFGCTVQGFEDQSVFDRLGDSGFTTCAGQNYATPGFFDAMGIPVTRGRAFEDRDNDDPARASVVVSEAFARRFWPGEDPIGKGVAPSGRTVGPFYHVVGVVGDIPASTLDGDKAIAVFYPVVQDPNTPGRWGARRHTAMRLVVRTERGDPLSVYPAVRAVVNEVDPAAPVTGAMRLGDLTDRSMAHIAFVSVLLQIAAAVALVLAAVGLYAVIAYLIGRRTREIGTRLALGAHPAQVRRSVVADSTLLTGFGLVVGLALAWVTTRALESLLYGVAPMDPLVLGGAAALLAAIALLASWMPAQRASRIDPIEALRTE